MKNYINLPPKTSSLLFWRSSSFMLLIIVFILFITTLNKNNTNPENLVKNTRDESNPEELVLPENGVELPIVWGDLGGKLIEDGVINEVAFRKLYPEGLGAKEEQMLTDEFQGSVIMTQQNSGYLLNLLWAFGLANRNEILINGEMSDPRYGGDASRFASTGGWILAKGDVMDHYSAHKYLELTESQQELVEKVAYGVYRPCCGNSTHFPDCNHGMAMLGLLQLMAANNVSEEDMYKFALKVNSYWFPQTYLDLATYFKEQGIDWTEVDPKVVLGSTYSSGQGYAETRKQIKSLPSPGTFGSGCGV